MFVLPQNCQGKITGFLTPVLTIFMDDVIKTSCPCTVIKTIMPPFPAEKYLKTLGYA